VGCTTALVLKTQPVPLSGLRLTRASVRASRECDDLGDVALEVLLEPVGILGELAAEAVPVAIADTALGVAHVAVGAGLANPGGVEERVEAVAALVECDRSSPNVAGAGAVRWLERYIEEQEPTLSDVALAVSALGALVEEQP